MSMLDRRFKALQAKTLSLPKGRFWKLVLKADCLILYWTTPESAQVADGDAFLLESVLECRRTNMLGGHLQSGRGLKYQVAISPAGWMVQSNGKPVVVTQPIRVDGRSQQFCIELTGGDNCLMSIPELFSVLHHEIDIRSGRQTEFKVLHNAKEEDLHVRPFVRAIRHS